MARRKKKTQSGAETEKPAEAEAESRATTRPDEATETPPPATPGETGAAGPDEKPAASGDGDDGRVLDQDEVDALLAGMDGDEPESEQETVEADENGVRPYDLTSQDRALNIRLPGLDMLNERFGRRFRVSLFNLLRCSVDVTVRPAHPQTFSQFMNRLPVPTSLNIVNVKPLYGAGLFVLDSRLVFTLVDFYFGGSGRFPMKVEGRDFTPTEIGIVKNVLSQAFADLSGVWSHLLELEFQYDRSEQNPRFASILTPDEVVIVSTFEIDLEGTNGTFSIMLPFSLLESVREMLTTGYQESPSDHGGNESRLSLDAIEDVEINATCEFGVTELSVGHLMSMTPGDILPMTQEEEASLQIEGMPLIKGQPGMKDGNYAFQVSRAIFEPEDGNDDA